MRKLFLATLLGLWPALALGGEPFDFTSHTYGGFPQLLRGEASGEISIKAVLDLPPGPGPHAALVVAHSCGGWTTKGQGEKTILDVARQAGFATLIYDSFDPRGWRDVCTGTTGPAGSPSVIADAFAALEALGKDGRFRKDAIFIAGASLGGMTSWFTALEPLRQSLIKGDLRFAGHSAFYPAGDHGFIADKVFAGGPILVMFGLDDDWTPPKRVRLMMERQQAYSKQPLPEIRFVEYEEGRHGWLNVEMRLAKYLPQAFSRLNCPLIYFGAGGAAAHLVWVDGREMDVTLSEIGKNLSGCASLGVTMEGSAAVTQKSLAEMTSFMTRALAHDRLTRSHPSDSELNVNRSLKQISRADSRLQSEPEGGSDFRRSALGQ